MLYNLSYSDTSWPYTNFLLLLLLPLLSKVYCLDVAKVFKNIKVVFENLIWHRNQQKPLGMCPLLLHVAHTLWKYTTSLLHKFMYPWHEILFAKKIWGLFGGCPRFPRKVYWQWEKFFLYELLVSQFFKSSSHFVEEGWASSRGRPWIWNLFENWNNKYWTLEKI